MKIDKNGIVHIGLPWGFNEWTDIDGYFTELIYANINTVDFIPVIPTVNTEILEDIKSQGKISNIFRSLYLPDVDKGCKYYNSMLKKFGLSRGCSEVKGVRLYLTDTTQVVDTITNSYQENLLHRMAKSVTEKGILSVGKKIGQAISQTTYNPPDYLLQLLEGKVESSVIKELTGTINALFSSMKIDYPVVWIDTQYVRRTTLNIVLSTPYGHPEAVWIWIVRPLIFLILLGVPLQLYGLVGYPLYVSIRAPGLFHIPLAAIESITIDRGGRNTLFNIYKQPLKLSINITIRDLYSTMSMDVTEDTIDAREIAKMITEPTEHDSINITKTSLPTVDKLIKSFMPEKRSFRVFKSRMKMVTSPPKIKHHKINSSTRNVNFTNTVYDEYNKSTENMLAEILDDSKITL